MMDKHFLTKIENKIARRYKGITHFINRIQNKKILNQKVFCIGLHKTGTFSLFRIATQLGYKAIHDTNWNLDNDKLEKFEFFCDGGSHFDGQEEFNFEDLYSKYPNALFILQTRNAEKWIISKLIHIGWTHETKLQPNDPSKLLNNDWKYESLLSVEKFIEHKFNYEQKVKTFFENNNRGRLLTLDITDKTKQQHEIERLMAFLGARSAFKIRLPHANKSKKGVRLSNEILNFVKEKINQMENEKQVF